MTCLIGNVLDGPGMEVSVTSHTFMLGTFFVYTLAYCMPIFKKISPLKRLRKSYKLLIVVTLLKCLKWKVCNFFLDVSGDIFSWKLAYKEPRYIQKCPQHRSMWLHSWPVQNFADQASHCSALLIGCVVTFMQPCVNENVYFQWCYRRNNICLIIKLRFSEEYVSI